jgi:predicted heme/steroid binding protein
MRIFTAQEVFFYNGKDGRPAYIAYKGKVYDVTNSFLWKGGRHLVLHDE